MDCITSPKFYKQFVVDMPYRKNNSGTLGVTTSAHRKSGPQTSLRTSGFAKILRNHFNLGRYVPFVSEEVSLYFSVGGIREQGGTSDEMMAATLDGVANDGFLYDVFLRQRCCRSLYFRIALPCAGIRRLPY